MTTTLPSLKMTRIIDAPVKKVFEAWTDPELMRQWMAPAPFEVGELRVDARLGGTYRISCADGDDGPHTTSGEYLEFVQDRRLVQTWLYEGPHGDDVTPSVLTVDFREVSPGVTELTLSHEKLREGAPIDAAVEGWTLILDKLAAFCTA